MVEELYCSQNSVLSDSDDDVKTYSSKHACAAASDTFAPLTYALHFVLLLQQVPYQLAGGNLFVPTEKQCLFR